MCGNDTMSIAQEVGGISSNINRVIVINHYVCILSLEYLVQQDMAGIQKLVGTKWESCAKLTPLTFKVSYL